MKLWIHALAALLLTAGLLAPAQARGEVTVSLTISGEVDEMIKILQRLKKMGVGGAQSGAFDEDAFRLQMHSESGKGDFLLSPLETLAPPKPPAPEASLRDAITEPYAVHAGGECSIFVKAIDPEYQIDTVAATVLGHTIDLIDDGTGSDAQAGDGTWSAKLTLPQDAAPDNYPIEITAYGAYGMPIQVEGDSGKARDLTAQARVNVMAPLPSQMVPPASARKPLPPRSPEPETPEAQPETPAKTNAAESEIAAKPE